MKKNLLTIIITTVIICAKAQPVLQQANLAQPGFSATINVGPAVSPGSSGANQTWNFSTATSTPAGAYSIINCSATPCSASFTTSNWCYSVPGPKYHYLRSTSTLLEQKGKDIPVSCSGGSTYSDPKTVLIFPFNYTNSNTDPWIANTGTGTYTATYDGYGTLSTPFGTYNNVVRVTNVDGTNISTVWLTVNPIYQVMTIDAGGNTIILSNESLLEIKDFKDESNLTISPNPANGLFSIYMNKKFPDATVRIYNMLGEQIYSSGLSFPSGEIDLTGKDKGMYVCKIFSGVNFVSCKKIIIQ
jgi:hypothetical protein